VSEGNAFAYPGMIIRIRSFLRRWKRCSYPTETSNRDIYAWCCAFVYMSSFLMWKRVQ